MYVGAGLGGAAVGGGIGATAGALGEEGREKVGFTESVLAMFMTGQSPRNAPAK